MTLNPEVAAAVQLPDEQFIATAREMSHRLMDDLSREELYLLLGNALGRLQKTIERRNAH